MYYIHINRQTVAKNKKHGTSEPAVRVQKGKYGKPKYAHRLKFVEGEIEYKPSGDPILPCGARLVIKTKSEPQILGEADAS